jgi:hypothetical protein
MKRSPLVITTLALSNDFEAAFFHRLDCPEMINAGNLRRG